MWGNTNNSLYNRDIEGTKKNRIEIQEIKETNQKQSFLEW